MSPIVVLDQSPEERRRLEEVRDRYYTITAKVALQRGALKEHHIQKALDYYQVNFEDIGCRVTGTVDLTHNIECIYIDGKKALTFTGIYPLFEVEKHY